jgi:hypothetical protein
VTAVCAATQVVQPFLLRHCNCVVLASPSPEVVKGETEVVRFKGGGWLLQGSPLQCSTFVQFEHHTAYLSYQISPSLAYLSAATVPADEMACYSPQHHNAEH